MKTQKVRKVGPAIALSSFTIRRFHDYDATMTEMKLPTSAKLLNTGVRASETVGHHVPSKSCAILFVREVRTWSAR